MTKNAIRLLVVGIVLMIIASCKRDPYYFSFGKVHPSAHSASAQVAPVQYDQPLYASTNIPACLTKEGVQVKEQAQPLHSPAKKMTAQQKQAAKEFRREIKSIQKSFKKPQRAVGGAEIGPSQTTAFILATIPLLIGLCGIQRFYLGGSKNIIIGVIQLLTLGCCGIWQLVDIIRIATGELKPNSGDYAEKW